MGSSDIGDEFGDAVLRNVWKFLKFLLKETENMAKSASSRIRQRHDARKAAEANASAAREAAERAYDDGFAAAYSTGAVQDAAPEADGPVIEFTTRTHDPEGQMLTNWLDRAKIGYACDCATVPPCAVFTVPEADIVAAGEALEEAGIAQVEIPSVGDGAIGVESEYADAAAKALDAAGIEHSAPEHVAGLASVRIAAENLEPALNLIDKAVLAGIPGVDVGRFLNLEELHEEAGMPMPDFSRVGCSFDEGRADPAAAEGIDPERFERLEERAATRCSYVYPRSDAELDEMHAALEAAGVEHEAVAREQFAGSGFFAVAVNDASLQAALADMTAEERADMNEILHGSESAQESRDDMIESSVVAGDVSEALDAEIAHGDVSRSSPQASLTFKTVSWDRGGNIFTSQLDKAGIPYTKNTNPGSIEVKFAGENAPAVYETAYALANNGNINGMSPSRFVGMDELAEAVDRHAAPLVKSRIESEQARQLVCDSLLANQVEFTVSGEELVVNAASLAYSPAGPDGLESYINEVELGAEADAALDSLAHDPVRLAGDEASYSPPAAVTDLEKTIDQAREEARSLSDRSRSRTLDRGAVARSGK